MKLNKKIAMLLVAAMMINPAFAARKSTVERKSGDYEESPSKSSKCAKKCGNCFLRVACAPGFIPVGKKRDCGDLVLDVTNSENAVVAFVTVADLAIIGGITAGIVALVKYYKKKNQVRDQKTTVANELMQNHQEEIATDVQDDEEATIEIAA